MQNPCYAVPLFAAVVAFASAGVAAQTYSSRALATLGGSSNYGQAVNNKGQVVGFSTTTGDSTFDPFLTGINGAGITDVGSLGGYTLAYGVNDIGQVVGYGQPATHYNGQAFVTGPNGTKLSALGSLSATTYSRATGINNDGRVVGYIGDTSTNYDTAYIVQAKGAALQPLGTLGGGGSVAFAINNDGLVVGYSETAVPADDAFITGTNGKGMKDLGIGPDSAASAINDSAQVAGTAADASSNQYGFVTAPHGGAAVRLGTLGGANSWAFGLSNTGQVVGWAQIPSGDYHAYVFRGGAMLDLNALVTLPADVILIQANAINDRGQIVAQANNSLTYLLSPPVGEQLASVLQILVGAGANNSLLGKVTQAQTYYAARDLKDTCFSLNAFGEAVKEEQSSQKLSQAFALELSADAQGLMAAVGCGN